MKILFVSKEGDSSGLWYRCQQEGAKVSAYIRESWARPIYDGIVPKCETIEEGLKEKPDVIIFDLNGMGKVADSLRKEGWKVVNGSELADRMEFDRAWGVKLCEQYGIRVPKTSSFDNVSAAIEFVKRNQKPLAVKMDSNAGGESASYVSKNQEDMLDYLSQQKESGKIEGNTFILQEVVKGAEISTELWFCDGAPLWPANSTLEDKKFLAGGLGQRTGCEVSSVCHYQGDESKIIDKTIRKLFPLLKHARYTGCLDVNCIVSEVDHEPYFLEFTPRLGYSAIYAYLRILGMSIGDYFYRISRGAFTIPFAANWGCALKISIPPYPAQIEPEEAARETYGNQAGMRINGKYGKDFIPIDVRKGKKTEFECSGTTCIIGEATGCSDTLLGAWRMAQRCFKSVEIPNSQGRYTDGLESPWKRILALRRMGYTEIPSPTGREYASNSLV